MTDYERIEKAIHYVVTHRQEQPSLDDIAHHLHLSRPHFERLFKRWAGVSPKRFLQYTTLAHARELLQNDLSVLDTSLTTGLSGPGRLHDLFVSIEAMTPGEFKTGGAGLVIRYGVHDTLFGPALMAVTDKGLCFFAFDPAEPEQDQEALLYAHWPKAKLTRDASASLVYASRLQGEATASPPSSLPLYVKGTNFQLQVWRALVTLPEGALVSYEGLATRMGRPEATRAVSTAVARNPVGYFIPCHRVIRKTGIIGKYHWGSDRKQALIGWEQARKEALKVA